MFRNRERGDLHLPEFTMLEWYRADDAYDAIMADCVVVIAHAAQATGIAAIRLSRQDLRSLCRAGTAHGRRGFRALRRHRSAGDASRDGEGDRERACRRPRRQGAGIAADDTWSDIFSQRPGRACRTAISGRGA